MTIGPLFRRGTIKVTGGIGPPAAAAVPALIARLRTPTAASREEAAVALGRIGAAAKSAVPDLLRLAADPNAPGRLEAVRAVNEIGPAAASDEAGRALLALADDRDVGADALGRARDASGQRIAPRPGSAVPAW